MQTREAAVYRFFSAEGRLLYIGCSYNPFQRWATHGQDKPWMREVARMEVAWFDTHREAAAEECRAIREEAPLYNRQQPLGRQGERVVIGYGPELLKDWMTAQRKRGIAGWRLGWDLDRLVGDYNKITHLRMGRRAPDLPLAAAIERLTEGAVPASSWLVKADAKARPMRGARAPEAPAPVKGAA